MNRNRLVGMGVAAGLGIAAAIGAGSVTPGPELMSVTSPLSKTGNLVKISDPGQGQFWIAHDGGWRVSGGAPMVSGEHIYTDAGVTANVVVAGGASADPAFIVANSFGKICLKSDCSSYIAMNGANGVEFIGSSVSFVSGSATFAIGSGQAECLSGCPATKVIPVKSAYGGGIGDCELLFRGNVLLSTTCAGYDAGS